MKLTLLKASFVSLLAITSALTLDAGVVIFDGRNPVSYNQPLWKKRPITEIASEMLDSDIESVTGLCPVKVDVENARIKIFNLQTADSRELTRLRKLGIKVDDIRKHKDGFALKANKGNLYIVGADDRGTAYGMLEVSRLAGVSPWVWWNDAVPAKKERIEIGDKFTDTQYPSVEYRGIFLNDEDWTLQPWSWMTFEPGQPQGTIGAKTYKEIFKLLLRLRGNVIWPAMHGISTPFYFVAGAKEIADSCGIAIGTSHCEPLMRNNVGEWKEAERGEYNYITNSESVKNYWTERLKEAGRYENMYTIGMRGIHDGEMQGVKTMEEKVAALQLVIDDQRELLSQYVDTAVTKIPQVFVPYKEVLDIMDNGLKVPDDVTLMWCDDNYGYMTRLSDNEQQERSGGAGVYYHLSYWGRPHDYMWLGTTQPGLVYSEMKEAYDCNARKVWIVNVHDMKTASYPMELFLDMAWNINSVDVQGVADHLKSWLCREFGDEIGIRLTPAMMEYYRLNAIRRPEHMGWTQVELSDRKAYPRGRSHVVDTEFSFNEFGSEADRYMRDYKKIADEIEEIEQLIPTRLKDCYFAQIKYPVLCGANMAYKMLEAQRARSYAVGQCDKTLWNRDSLMLGACALSMDAYRKIRELTEYYNNSLADGKWKHSMCMNPRDLCVFNPPVLPIGLSPDEIDKYLNYDITSKNEITTSGKYIALDAAEYSHATFKPISVSMLGHSQNAVPIPKGECLSFVLDIDYSGPVSLIIALIPTQPGDIGDIRVKISVDGNDGDIFSFKEEGRTDTWKENVLRNQARIKTKREWPKGKHTLTVTALDNHIILDQIMLDTKVDRKFYVIPTASAVKPL